MVVLPMRTSLFKCGQNSMHQGYEYSRTDPKDACSPERVCKLELFFKLSPEETATAQLLSKFDVPPTKCSDGMWMWNCATS